MREQIEERLGLFEGQDLDELLQEQDSDVLMELVQEFADDEIDLELDGDESRQCMIMSYAIASALRDEREFITAEDIEQATAEFANDLGEDVEPEEEAEETKADEQTEQPAQKFTWANVVRDYVQRFPDDTKDEVVNAILEQYEDANPNTIGVEFYKARWHFDLPPNGKRGRPSGTSKVPLFAEKIKTNPNMSRKEIMEWGMEEFDLAQHTASNYYAQAKREMS